MSILETSLEEVVREPKSKSLLSAIGGPQFLAAQFFTMLATIAGVYLAGYISFQRTLEYDRYVKAQQRLDMLTAMHAELQQNITRIRTFNGQLAEAENKGNYVLESNWPQLRLFVWEASGRSPSAFDIPPEILTNFQAFYNDLHGLLNNPTTREAFRHLNSLLASDRRIYKQNSGAQLEFAEASISPALEKAIAGANRIVQKYAVPAGAPN
jgi:hypothetical protein